MVKSRVINVMVYFNMRALFYNGWCGANIISWSVLRGKTIFSCDAYTDDYIHVMLSCYISILLVLLYIYNVFFLESSHSCL